MILYGTGGHAKVIVNGLRDCGKQVSAYFDDDTSKQFGTNILPYCTEYHPEESVIIAIGDNKIRKRIASIITHSAGILVHPSVLLPDDFSIGVGTVILHRAIIQTGCRIGRHVIVNTGASIDHDCVLEDFVHLAPGVILCGTVSIGEGSLIGAGSIITPNVKIGKNCFISAGSIISRSLPDNTIIGKGSGRNSLN